LGDAFGVWEQEVRKKTQASAAAALKRLLNIGTYNSRHRCARLREFYCKRHGEEQEQNTGGIGWRGRYSFSASLAAGTAAVESKKRKNDGHRDRN
jgi:hypothetical protein